MAKKIHLTGHKTVIFDDPIELADDDSIALPDSTAGWCFVLVGNGEEYAHFVWDSAGVVNLLLWSDNVVDTDTDDKFCIFNTDSTVYIRNRLGSTKVVLYDPTCYVPEVS